VGKNHDSKITEEGVVILSIRIRKDIKNLIYRFRDDDVTALASQLAYGLLISFFPFLIFLMTLIGFSSIESEDVLRGLSQFVPASVFELIRNTVITVVDTRNHNLLSLSLILTIWISSAGFKAVIKGINKAYDEPERRSFIRLEIVAILCTLALNAIIFLSLALLVLGEVVGYNIGVFLGYPEQSKEAWDVFKYLVIVLIMILVFAAMYRYTPSKKLTWWEVFPGAIFATLGWIAVSVLFAFYVNNFGNYSTIFGSIGAIIILLTWLFMTSVIIIMGGEVNATLAFDSEGIEKPIGKKF